MMCPSVLATIDASKGLHEPLSCNVAQASTAEPSLNTRWRLALRPLARSQAPHSAEAGPEALKSFSHEGLEVPKPWPREVVEAPTKPERAKEESPQSQYTI